MEKKFNLKVQRIINNWIFVSLYNKVMTYFIKVGIFLCILTFSINSFSDEVLTLNDCFSFAKESNPRLIQAQRSIEEARAGIPGAYSSYYPSLDLSSGYGRSRDGYTGDGSYSTSIGLKYPFYQGGYIRAGTEIAKSGVKIAEENYRLAEIEVFLSIKEAFFKLLQKKEQIAIVEKVLNRRKEALVIIKLKYEAGRESFPATEEAEAELLQAQYDKMVAEEEMMLAKVDLNLLLGRGAREEISVKYEDRDIEFPAREELIESAKTVRPEIRIEKINREILGSKLKQAKSGFLPTLSLSSSYGYNGSKLFEQDNSWSAGINLTFPIFNGFMNYAQVKSASLAIQVEGAKIQDIEQRLEEEVEQAYSNWVLAEKNLQVQEKTLKATRDMYELTRLQYEQGRTPYFFLQLKEASLTRAEYSYNNALFNLRITIARLAKACGR